jgi:hypothetical protein
MQIEILAWGPCLKNKFTFEKNPACALCGTCWGNVLALQQAKKKNGASDLDEGFDSSRDRPNMDANQL